MEMLDYARFLEKKIKHSKLQQPIVFPLYGLRTQVKWTISKSTEDFNVITGNESPPSEDLFTRRSESKLDWG